MADHKRFKPLIIIISFFITLNALLFYGFVRDGTWLVIAILLVPLCFKIGHINFLIMSVSFAVVTLALVLVFQCLPRESIFQYPHSILISRDSHGRYIYKPNKSVTMTQKYGNLKSVSSEGVKIDYESRKVFWKIDSFGFRNDSDYSYEKFILVGDSFIAGNGNSQEDLISSRLKEKYGAQVYNLGIMGDIADYVSNINKFKAKYGSDFKALMFIFEGNDFIRKATINKIDAVRNFKVVYKNLLREYKSFFSRTYLYRYTYAAYKSITKNINVNEVKVIDINGHRMGYHDDGTEVVTRESYDFPPYWAEGIASVKNNLESIIFIPAKYRVYHDFPNPAPKDKLPSANWESIRNLGLKLGIPTIDLTQPLREESKELLKKNEFTFWKDDTHWNRNGMAVAARVICERIRALGCVMPTPATIYPEKIPQPLR